MMQFGLNNSTKIIDREQRVEGGVANFIIRTMLAGGLVPRGDMVYYVGTEIANPNLLYMATGT